MSNNKILAPVESLAKVEGWIKSSNFESESTIVSEYNEPLKPIENLKLSVDNDADTIVSSTTKEELQKTRSKANQTGKEDKVQYSSTVNSYESVESMTKLVETLKSNSMIKGVAKISSLSSPWQLYEGRAKSKSEPPDQFSTIIEAEESVRCLISATFIFLTLIFILPVFCIDLLTFCLFSPF